MREVPPLVPVIPATRTPASVEGSRRGRGEGLVVQPEPVHRPGPTRRPARVGGYSGAAADGTRGGSGAASVPQGKLVIYKSLEIVDDRVIPRYGTEPPKAGTYEVVKRNNGW